MNKPIANLGDRVPDGRTEPCPQCHVGLPPKSDCPLCGWIYREPVAEPTPISDVA